MGRGYGTSRRMEQGNFDQMSNNQGRFAATESAIIIMQIGSCSSSGEHRRQAIAQGRDAVMELEQRVQTALAYSGVCPASFAWVPLKDGYICCAGLDFISSAEIDRKLDYGIRRRMDTVNYPYVDDFDNIIGWAPLKRPPPQVPRWLPCWTMYELYRYDLQVCRDRERAGLPW